MVFLWERWWKFFVVRLILRWWISCCGKSWVSKVFFLFWNGDFVKWFLWKSCLFLMIWIIWNVIILLVKWWSCLRWWSYWFGFGKGSLIFWSCIRIVKVSVVLYFKIWSSCSWFMSWLRNEVLLLMVFGRKFVVIWRGRKKK